MDKRSFLSAALTVGSALAFPTMACAQAGYPSGPIRIILPVPPGGASDAAARLVGQAISKGMGQPVVVENRPGANGLPAMQAVLAAPADGHTLLWTLASMAAMPQLMKSSPVKSLSELTPISSIVNVSFGLVVSTKLPVSTVAELTAHLKANPDKLSYPTGPLAEYMSATQYLRHFGLSAQRVPYKGGAQLIPDLINGDVQFYFGALTPLLPHVRSGKLRLLATLPDRNEWIPGVPPLAASGVATENVPTWNGLMAPPRTPPEVAVRISQEVSRALTDPTLRAALEAQGFRIAGGTPAQMAESIQVATGAWARFIHDYNIPQE